VVPRSLRRCTPLSGGTVGLPLRWNLDLLAPEQVRVQRTAARTKHRECGAHRREMDVHPGLGGMQDGKAQFHDANQRAGERCPQADQQQDCGPRGDHFRNGRGRRSDRQQPRTDQRSRGGSAQEYQAGARQTARKGREKSLHKSPLLTLARSGHVRPPRKSLSEAPLSRGVGLQVDDSAFQTDRDGVRPIVCGQLGEDVLDVALDGFFRDGELVGDHLVGVPAGDESEHFDFPQR
jgi:hypothetical protein